MGTNAEGASGAGENSARNWQRGATRRAILEATRLVAARQNSADFSLNTVAKEAGYSTTTIFAYFQTKSELFNAVVADDLAMLARQMRDGYFSIAAEPQPLCEQESAAPAAELERTPSTVVTFAPAAEAKAENGPDETAKQPPRADAWLERRLRVFERTLADVETRLATAQTASAKALSAAEDVTRIFGARLDVSEKRSSEISNDMTTRLSAAEKRLRENHGELRNSLLDISMRIDSLETEAQNLATGAGRPAPVIADIPNPEEIAPVETPLTAATDTYLSAARRAALTAEALAKIEETPRTKPARNFWFNRETAILAAAIAVLFVFAAMIAYALGEKTGRSTPVHIVATLSTGHSFLHPSSPDRLGALADAGNPQAQLLVGLRYLKGQGVAVNQPEAAKWIRKAAAHDPVAQYWMGQITEYGEGVSADTGEALHWYQAAANNGNRDAMYNLGIGYAEGLGTQRDFAQSAHWFAQAAALGVTNAQFNLAVLYERGGGVSQSLPNAYEWYAIAANNGDAESKQRADAIATQISPSVLKGAKKFAADFKPGAFNLLANTTPIISRITLARAF